MLAKIAFRNIFRNRRRTLITLLVLVMGAAGLILFGGYKEMNFWGLRESTIRNRLGHLQLYRKGYLSADSQKPLEYGLEDVAEIRVAVEKDPRVAMTAAQITFMGLISNGEKSETFLGTAVEPAKDRQMRSQRLESGRELSDGEMDALMVGRGLARSMNVKIGDYLTLMTTTVTGSLNAMDFQVVGTFMTGVKEYDDRAIKVPLSGAHYLLNTKKIEKLLVMLKQTEDTDAVMADVQALATSRNWPIEMRPWSDLAGFYHQVVLIFNGIFGFIGTIVFVIVVLSVANTIMMNIFERTREIGTLMAIGTKRKRIWALFLLEGAMIGLIGGVLGLVFGAVLGQVINYAQIQLPPPPGYTAGYQLRILMRPSILVSSFALSIVTATLSSIYPAFKASRLNIVDALGHI
ncbi:MAG: ABC transporter permease [Acidobacteria bacterium]|nr:MAG: ABC transporter permease [Acidobacteriota bacterium]